jgi:hypothetical protein
MKKKDLPAMPFYWGDWFKATDVQSMSRECKCIWFEMLGRMWESNERGVLVSSNGSAYSDENVCNMLGISRDLLEQIERTGVFSRRTDGAIFSRRMVRDENIRCKRATAGAVGGANTVLLKQNPKQNSSKH